MHAHTHTHSLVTVTAAKVAKKPVSQETANIWSLSADDVLDDDIVNICTTNNWRPDSGGHLYSFQELVDSDTLLAEEDLLKPDPSTLRSTTISLSLPLSLSPLSFSLS